MKRILTVLIAICTMSVSMEQSGRNPSQQRNSRDVVLGQSNGRTNDGRYGNHSSFSERERAEHVNRIRYHYREKIQDVRHSRYLRPAEKRRQVHILELQRDQEIRRINDYFRNQRNGHYDNSRRNNRRY